MRNARIAAFADDGSRVAATVQTRRERTDVDHQRYGDPTYISPVSTRLMVIDTRSGDQTWVHEEPAQIRGFAWSPAGMRLGYFMVENDRYTLRIFDATSGNTTAVAVNTEKEIASSSLLEWSPDGATILLGMRPDGRADEGTPGVCRPHRRRRSSCRTHATTSWPGTASVTSPPGRSRHLVSVADGTVREILSDRTPRGVGFSEDGAYITYSTATRTKTSYTRRDGTDYELLMLALDGGEPASLRGPGEERINVSWTEARDAFAYSEDGSVFVQHLDEEEGVDVTEAHRAPKGGR